MGVYPWAMYNSPPFDVCTNFVDELPFFFDELGSELDIISATKNLTFPVGFFVGCIDFFRSRTSRGIRIWGKGVAVWGCLFRINLNYTFASH